MIGYFAGRPKRYPPVHPVGALGMLLQRISNDRFEVLIAISNKNLLADQLPEWVRRVQQAKIRNHIVLALDEETRNAMIQINVPVFLCTPATLALEGTHNHAASAQKFHIIGKILRMGYHVFLSDTDVAWFQNPFASLDRDADVAAMTDGYTNETAYGAITGDDDPTMKWSRYSQAWRIHALNSGLFYVRSNERTIALMDSIHGHLQERNDWDQSVFNMYIQAPLGYPGKTAGVTLRVLDYNDYMNSKTLFRYARGRRMPVALHLNYHPDKSARLAAAEQHFLRNDSKAFDALPEA